MRLFNIIVKGFFVLSISPIFSTQYTYLDNTLSNNIEKPLVFSYSVGKFDESLDVFNYADNLTSTKPKEATVDNFFLSYKFVNRIKIGIESNKSSGKVERLTYPKSLETKVNRETLHFSFNLIDNSDRFYDLGLFYGEEKQEPLTIDCYAFNSTVVGGSCAEAKLRLLDGEIYRSTGELVYLPVLSTSGSSESFGFLVRSSPKSLDLFSFTHTLSIKQTEITQSNKSEILNTTDSFVRQINIDGQSAGSLLDSFKQELPQTTPWKEMEFRYSASTLYSFTDSFALSLMYSFIKVNRSDYQDNPNKKDFDKNNMIDLTAFYKLHKNIILYTRLSASSNYILGESPLAYNRRSNHLFDHPYGQFYIGTLVTF